MITDFDLDEEFDLNKDKQHSNQLRIKELSYSSCCTLHSCPRKFLLDKTASHKEDTPTVTFAFGHAVGEGIQQVLLGSNWTTVLWSMFKIWDTDLLEEEAKSKKSIWEAVLAVQKFKNYYEDNALSEYALATVNGKPAVEVAFKINLPNGYIYRGFVDVVLQHKHTGKFLILELKTTGAYKLDEAQYKNSFQALGYAVMLSGMNLLDTANLFEVRYLVYKTRAKEFSEFSFIKTASQKNAWIETLLVDCNNIESMLTKKYFPRYGESCYAFFRQCKHFSTCHLKETSLGVVYTRKSIDTCKYEIELNIGDIT